MEDEDYGDGEQDAFHEPEFALILVACLIGIGTGASVVLFNDAVEYIRGFSASLDVYGEKLDTVGFTQTLSISTLAKR